VRDAPAKGLTVVNAAIIAIDVAGANGSAVTRFYGIVFGWRAREDPATPGRYLVAATENAVVAAVDPAGDDGSDGERLRVAVWDLPEAVSLAEEVGGTIVAAPRADAWRVDASALVADPAGRVVRLKQAGDGRAPGGAGAH